MAFFLYASFPNSRNKPRNPTVQGLTFQTVAGALGSIPTKVAEIDLNRTDLEVTNLSSSINVFYLYTIEGAADPSVVATFGLTGDLYFRTGANTFYLKGDDGTTTNWVLKTYAQLATIGFLVLPDQTFRSDVIANSVWVGSTTIATPAICVDRDRG